MKTNLIEATSDMNEVALRGAMPLDQMEFVEIIKGARKRQRRWQQALAGTMTARQVETSVGS